MSLPHAQPMAMIYLTEGIDRPSDLAEKLRVSKQATQQALKELQVKAKAKAIVELQPDPNNGRQKRVVFTTYGRDLGNIAKRGVFELEAELSRRIGANAVLNMRKALNVDWGTSPNYQDLTIRLLHRPNR